MSTLSVEAQSILSFRPVKATSTTTQVHSSAALVPRDGLRTQKDEPVSVDHLQLPTKPPVNARDAQG